MLVHTAQVRGRKIAWDKREVVQHGLNADAVVLDLDEEWRECDRIQAVLAGAGEPVRILVEGGGFNLPSALMERTGPVRMCLIGYVGETARIVTAKEAKPLTVVESGEMGGADPAPEQPDLWAKLMEEVRKATEGAKTAAQSATRAEADLRAAAERGDFDGEDGKTPVRGVDYWTAEDRKPIEDATLAATTAAGRAEAAAATATEGEASRVAAEAERANAEAARAEAELARGTAETGRVEAEATRAANETKRTESFNTNLVSWNSKVDAACKKATDTASKAAQDAKTATDAAIAKTEEATQAAVAKAQTATDNATTAANKAETVVAQLPVPSGNVLKGEAESTFINLHDSWKAPILQGKVLGQSNQVTTKGKNLVDGMEEICSSSDLPTNLQNYCWGYSLGQNPLKLNQPLKAGTYTFSYYADKMAAIYFSQAPYNGTNEQFVINTKAIGETKNGLNRYYGTVELKNDSDIIGIYSDYKKCCCGMLSEGASLLPYEPYTGCKPSPSPEYPQEITNLNKAELVITGKNLINPNRLAQIDSSYYQAVDGQLKVINSHNAAWKDVPIYGTLQAGTYTLSGDNIEIRDTALNQIVNIMSTQVKQFTLNNPTAIKMKIGYGWPKYPVITKAQLEVGSKATACEHHKSKNTVIDLKGNELCSLPKGVKDEVVIDAEGNVSLIKRVAKYVVPENVYAQDETNNFGVQLKLNAVDDKYLHKQLCPENAKYSPSVNWLTVFKEGNNWANLQEFKQWFIGTEFYYGTKNPETIQLGKVELPALPEATSNVWNDGNIPANVYINYLKDVNIAYADLESKLTQAVVAAAANL